MMDALGYDIEIGVDDVCILTMTDMIISLVFRIELLPLASHESNFIPCLGVLIAMTLDLCSRTMYTSRSRSIEYLLPVLNGICFIWCVDLRSTR